MRSEMLFGEERLDESCVRAGLVADIHYSDMPDNDNRYYVESEAKLKESVSVMNKVGPEFMVELGDLKDISKNKADNTPNWQKDGYYIGGDRFGNYEGLLPDGDYRECDIDSLGKERGAKRIVYDLTDWDIYYTGDHYKSFTQLY